MFQEDQLLLTAVLLLTSIRAITDNAMLVTADMVGLYPSIPYSKFFEKPSNSVNKQVPTSDLVKIVEFVLSNYFEFTEERFVSPYTCINMDEEETEFLQTQRFKPLVWLR